MLARARERAGDHAAAFQAYRESNEAVRLPFDDASYFDELERIIATFTPELLARVPRPSRPCDLPVFVAGFPRSGTTLVDRIIDAHPQAIGLGESVDLSRMRRDLTLTIGSSLPWPECIGDLDAEDVERLAGKVAESFRRRARRAVRAADKSLENWQSLGLIAILCPAARVIHIRRDALDTCLSCYFERLHPASHRYALDLRQLGRVHRGHQRLMEHWKAVLDLPILDVDYEQLTRDPEPVVRRIIEFCGLPWDERCLRFHETGRAAATLSHDQVRRPMYTTSVERWRKFEPHLGPLREALDA